MGEAKRRGTFDQRKSEAEFYRSEEERLTEWLRTHRPRVTYTNSHGGVSTYFSCVSLAALTTWAETHDQDVIITL